MDMNYLVQRRILAKKRYRRKVMFTITLCGLLLILILVGLIKILVDEKATENGNKQGIQSSVSTEESHPAQENGTPAVTEAPELTATPTPTLTPTPVPPKKVAIDAGHGGDDWGSTRNGLYEKDANLAIAFYLKQKLEDAGYAVFMVRDEDVQLELLDRPVYAEEANADIYVSIHLNSLESDSDATRGFEVWYEDRREDGSDVLAQNVAEELDELLETRNRGVKKDGNLAVLKYVDMPAILIECGFITSETEREMLFTPEYQETIAEGIFNGILRFLPVE